MSEREESSDSGFTGSPWAAVALLAILVGASVALAFAGWEPGAIVGFLTPVAGMAATLLTLLKINQRQTKKLDTIAHRVNGELDKRMADAAQKAVEDGLIAVLGHDPRTVKRAPGGAARKRFG